MKKINLPLIGLIIGYLLTRLPRLDLIPIFTDEAIYLRWAQVMSNNLHYFFLPLTDGKPPLFIWATALFMHFFPSVDPLISGRLVSVISGLFAVVGIYFAARLLFKNQHTAILAGIFYLVCPFTFFYDRFSLVDGMLTTFGIWSLVFALKLLHTSKIKYAGLLGLIIGLGLLTKTTALFFFLFYPLGWLFLKFDFHKSSKKEAFKIIIFSFITIVLAESLFYSLKIFNEFYIIGIKNSSFLIPLADFIKDPFTVFLGNIQPLLLWQEQYLTWPLSLLAIISFIVALFQKSREKLFLIFTYLIYLLAMAAMNKVIYARYLLIFTPLIFLLVASFISDLEQKFKNKLVIIFATIIICLPCLYGDYQLLTNPPAAPIADNDSNQYLNSWSAGYGIKETVQFLAQQSKKSPKIVIGMEGTFGLLPFALEMYSHQYPNVEIKSYWPPSDQLPPEIASAAKDVPTYFIIYQRETHSPLMPLTLIAKYQEGNSSAHFQLYKVNPK